MIGRFWYDNNPGTSHLVVRLAWIDGMPSARVELPPEIIDQAQYMELPIRADDQYMQIPYAMAFAVLVAGVVKASLTLTGDVSTWPDEWGALQERPKTFLVKKPH